MQSLSPFGPLTPHKEFFEKISEVLKSIDYAIDNVKNEQYLTAYSVHKWITTPLYPNGYAASVNKKRKLQLNYDKDDQRIFFGITEDGNTRNVFNGIVYNFEDIIFIDKLTRILPIG